MYGRSIAAPHLGKITASCVVFLLSFQLATEIDELRAGTKPIQR
jgi:hypothetical protein